MNRHLTPGCKTAILINGIPASGKSTITRLLAETFSLPVLTIDGIKDAVYGAPGPCRPADESPAGLRGV
ncbi:glucokinase [Klebsiella pneumoniae]|nr:glucokinase [Klebsiella pneumoniae]SYF94420.1 glucokinase [Klebsiella pneumoniae]SYG11422.1 glucokinase [Klebsiella pneumoniae]SYG16510.1 glucokinase [Klebsiella pneumoniae]SYG23657.1 glucokinase [Klebsiella pneumoniae]